MQAYVRGLFFFVCVWVDVRTWVSRVTGCRSARACLLTFFLGCRCARASSCVSRATEKKCAAKVIDVEALDDNEFQKIQLEVSRKKSCP